MHGAVLVRAGSLPCDRGCLEASFAESPWDHGGVRNLFRCFPDKVRAW
jgi:hypothetical protein